MTIWPPLLRAGERNYIFRGPNQEVRKKGKDPELNFRKLELTSGLELRLLILRCKAQMKLQ